MLHVPSNAIDSKKLVATAWLGLCIYVAMMIATQITADGLRTFHSCFSGRVHFEWLFRILGFRRIDLGIVLGVILVVLAFYFMERFLRDLLLVESSVHHDIEPDRNRLFYRTIGIAFVSLDAMCFFWGLTQPTGWDPPASSTGIVLLTALYVCLMAAMAYINILLWLRIERV